MPTAEGSGPGVHTICCPSWPGPSPSPAFPQQPLPSLRAPGLALKIHRWHSESPAPRPPPPYQPAAGLPHSALTLDGWPWDSQQPRAKWHQHSSPSPAPSHHSGLAPAQPLPEMLQARGPGRFGVLHQATENPGSRRPAQAYTTPLPKTELLTGARDL